MANHLNIAGLSEAHASEQEGSTDEDDIEVMMGPGSDASSGTFQERESNFEDESTQNDEYGFLDVEALESRNDSECGSDAAELRTFPYFGRLPAELRLLVWQFLCPDMTAKSRVFRFVLWSTTRVIKHTINYNVKEHFTLYQQTHPARAVLAVHRESRHAALKAFPDTLAINSGHDIIRFDKERDVVYLSPPPAAGFAPVGFFEKIRHLALPSEPSGAQYVGFHRLFPNLKTLYFVFDGCSHHGRQLRWSASEFVNCYRLETVAEDIGLGEDLHFTYCWPDLCNHRDFAEQEVPVKDVREKASFLCRPLDGAENDEVAWTTSFEVWPMVEYELESGMEQLQKLRLWSGRDEDWESSADSSETSPDDDEYESSGIDDSDIGDDGDTGDEEDDLVVQPLSDDDDATSFGGFPPPQNGAIGAMEYPAAQFSSPEQELARTGGLPCDPGSDEEPSRAGRRATRRVLPSDSEDDSEQEPLPKKYNRATNRRHPLLSDSEEDDDDSSSNHVSAGKDQASFSKEGGSEDASGEDSGGSGVVSRPMSLAERLRLHREENQIPPSDAEEDYEDDDGYNHGSHDDESVEEDEASENGLILDGAEESDGDEAW